MKRSVEPGAISSDATLLAADVGRDQIHLYGRLGSEELERVLANRSDCLEEALASLRLRVETAGLPPLLLVCEPSGGFQDKLVACASSSMTCPSTPAAGRKPGRPSPRSTRTCARPILRFPPRKRASSPPSISAASSGKQGRSPTSPAAASSCALPA